MGFLALLIPLLAQILPSIFGNMNQVLQAKQQLELAQITAQSNIAMEVAKDQALASQTIVNATSPRFKYWTFWMFFTPFIVGAITPSFSQQVFQNLSTMPNWYTQTCMTLILTVWGIQVAAPVISNIFSNLGNFIVQRRADLLPVKLAKIDRVAFYNSLRAIKGSLSESDVTTDDKVLDALDKQNGNS